MTIKGKKMKKTQAIVEIIGEVTSYLIEISKDGIDYRDGLQILSKITARNDIIERIGSAVAAKEELIKEFEEISNEEIFELSKIILNQVGIVVAKAYGKDSPKINGSLLLANKAIDLAADAVELYKK